MSLRVRSVMVMAVPVVEGGAGERSSEGAWGDDSER